MYDRFTSCTQHSKIRLESLSYTVLKISKIGAEQEKTSVKDGNCAEAFRDSQDGLALKQMIPPFVLTSWSVR